MLRSLADVLDPQARAGLLGELTVATGSSLVPETISGTRRRNRRVRAATWQRHRDQRRAYLLLKAAEAAIKHADDRLTQALLARRGHQHLARLLDDSTKSRDRAQQMRHEAAAILARRDSAPRP